MAFESIKPAQDAFNERYGVQFDIKKFNKQLTRTADANEIYRAAYLELCDKAYRNFFDDKFKDGIDFAQMFYQFESEIIAPYRKECEGKGKNLPGEFGGWIPGTFLTSVKKLLSDMPTNNQDYIEQRYNQKDIRLRDLRAEFNSIKNDGLAASDALASLYVKIDTIDRVNENRKGLSFLGNLSRHFAEKRLIKSFKEHITQITGVPYDQRHLNPIVLKGEALASKSVNLLTQTAIQKAYDELPEDAKSPMEQNPIKEQLNLKDEIESTAHLTEVSPKHETSISKINEPTQLQ